MNSKTVFLVIGIVVVVGLSMWFINKPQNLVTKTNEVYVVEVDATSGPETDVFINRKTGAVIRTET